MADRNKIDDMYQIVRDDFDWINEDITQHKTLLKEKMKECIDKDNYGEMDDFRQKIEDIEKLTFKLINIKQEYISIVKEDDSGVNNNTMETNFDDLEDWTDTNPEEIRLFGKSISVKYWRDILLNILEEMIKRNQEFVTNLDKMAEFKTRTRTYFTYEEKSIEMKLYKKLSNGLYVMVNNNANTMVSVCRKILRLAGYAPSELQIRIRQDERNRAESVQSLEIDRLNNLIKLPPKYGSISLDKQLFNTLVHSIIKHKEEYGTDYFEPRKVEQKYETNILSNTKYTIAYHVVINIVKYLKDNKFIDNYEGTKKGKYIVIDDSSLQAWADNNIR